MANFEFFVTNSGTQRADKAARSHAIKTALQSRSKATNGEVRQDGAVESKRTARNKRALNGKFRLTQRPVKGPSAAQKALVRTKSPCSSFQGSDESSKDGLIVTINRDRVAKPAGLGLAWLGLEFLDPFGTIPIQSNPRIDSLMKHLIVWFDYLTTTVLTHKTWLARALSDPLLMKVTLSMAAAYGATQTSSFSRELEEEGWRLKSQVIPQINTILQNERVPENVLAAIAILCHTATLEGSFKEADLHMQAIHKLIAIRGGIKSIETYQVGRFINSADLELASNRGRRPYFPLIYTLDRAQIPPIIISASEYPSLSRLGSLGPESETLISVTHLLRQLIMAKRFNMDLTLRDIRVLLFSATHLSLDHVASTPTSSEAHCLHALLLAAHLFGCTALGQHNHWTASIPSKMAQRLRDSLKTWIQHSLVWSNHLPDLVWALFVGAVANPVQEGDDAWFLSQLKVVWKLYQGQSKKEFEECLCGMAWDGIFGVELVNSWFPGGMVGTELEI